MSVISPVASLIDPRGPRFAAWVTSAVLAGVLLAPAPLAGLLLTAQVIMFALGSRGRSPYVGFWKRYLRSGTPSELEPAAPPRFAQLVGLAVALVGVVGFATGAPLVGYIATGLALVAALLNAAIGLCLGCELYLLFVRFRRSTTKGVPA